MKKLLLVLLLVWSTVTLGEGKRDGRWWLGQSKEAKEFYVTGYLDGIELGNEFSFWKYSDNEDFVLRVGMSFNDQMARYIYDTAPKQIIVDLETFYFDGENIATPINEAIWVVLRKIAGDPESEIKEAIENLHRRTKK